jgi:hypothetical protein
MNVTGQIGEKMKITTNYNTEAQFDFENQVKLDYTGKDDEIIRKIEAGNVSLPLSSSLITGSQALFGLKTQLQFGRLNVTSIFSQQKSQQREITISNGSQQNEFTISADNYETNKHYFLAQYFRNNYSKALENIPLNSSNVNITKLEVWVTNRANTSANSRDVLALLDIQYRALARKVPVIVGAACSPGMTGLLVHHVTRAFESIDEVHVAVHGTGGPQCARQHHDSLAGVSIGWHEGEWLQRPAGSGRELCWFPDPVGARDCYRFASPEPVLLQRIAPSLQQIGRAHV